jgi:hypothetical protein
MSNYLRGVHGGHDLDAEDNGTLVGGQAPRVDLPLTIGIPYLDCQVADPRAEHAGTESAGGPR